MSVAQLQAEFKRGCLRTLYRQAHSGFATSLALKNVLESFQSARFEDIQSGIIETSVAGNGYSATLNVGAIGRMLSPEQVFMLSEELLSIFTDALATAGFDSSSYAGDAAQDETLFNIMLADDRMQRVTSTMDDQTLIRWNGMMR